MKVLSSQELINSVRSHADMQDSEFVTDAEIKHYLDLAYETLYDIIIDCNIDLYLKNIIFKGREEVAMQLPHDFYKLRGLDVKYGDWFFQARRVGFESRQHNQLDFSRSYDIAGIHENVRYSLRGNEIKVNGLAYDDNSTCILWYYPEPKGVGDGAKLYPGWQRYIIYSACRSCRVKEDSSTKDFYQEMMRARQDVEDFCVRRDWANNPVIANKDDISLTDDDYAYFASQPSLSEFNESKAVTLPPSLGEKTQLPRHLDGYRVDSKHVYIIDEQTAVCGLSVPRGMRGKYGSWIAVFMYRESGNVYVSQKSNTTYGSLDEFFSPDNLQVEIDPSIYTADKAFFSDRLYYTSALSYTTSKTELFDPPISNDPAIDGWLMDISWSTDGSIPATVNEELYQDNDVRTSIPATTIDAFLVFKFFPQDSTQQLIGLYFNSEINQLDAFTKTDATPAQPFVTYVSRNRLLADRFSGNRVRIVVGDVGAN